jgi:hypothetical protein
VRRTRSPVCTATFLGQTRISSIRSLPQNSNSSNRLRSVTSCTAPMSASFVAAAPACAPHSRGTRNKFVRPTGSLQGYCRVAGPFRETSRLCAPRLRALHGGSLAGSQCRLAPPPGLEPGTCGNSSSLDSPNFTASPVHTILRRAWYARAENATRRLSNLTRVRHSQGLSPHQDRYP